MLGLNTWVQSCPMSLLKQSMQGVKSNAHANKAHRQGSRRHRGAEAHPGRKGPPSMQRAQPAQHSAVNRPMSALTRNSSCKEINKGAERNLTLRFRLFPLTAQSRPSSWQRTFARHSGLHRLPARTLASHTSEHLCLAFTWKALSSTAGLRFSIMMCPTCTCSA